LLINSNHFYCVDFDYCRSFDFERGYCDGDSCLIFAPVNKGCCFTCGGYACSRCIAETKPKQCACTNIFYICTYCFPQSDRKKKWLDAIKPHEPCYNVRIERSESNELCDLRLAYAGKCCVCRDWDREFRCTSCCDDKCHCDPIFDDLIEEEESIAEEWDTVAAIRGNIDREMKEVEDAYKNLHLKAKKHGLMFESEYEGRRPVLKILPLGPSKTQPGIEKWLRTGKLMKTMKKKKKRRSTRIRDKRASGKQPM
jgi:hypothetical protein